MTRPSVLLVLSLTLAISAISPLVGREVVDTKARVPLGFEQEAAEKVLRDLYGARYRDTSRLGMRSFARVLLARASEERENVALQFVILRDARDIAARSGDAMLAFDVIDALAAVFDVKSTEMKEQALETARRSAREEEDLESIAEACMRLARDAFALDDYDRAKKFLRTGQTAARKVTDTSHTSRFRIALRQVARVQRSYRDARRAIDRLEADASLPDANLEAGRFYCFVKGAWRRGLRLLSHGVDERLAEVAKKELAALERQPAIDDLPRLADLWFEAARGLDRAEAEQARARAGRWLVQHAFHLSGVERRRVVSRIEELAEAVAPLSLGDPDPSRPSGLVAVRFEGDLAPFRSLVGPFRASGTRITHSGGPPGDHFLMPLAAASWLSVVVEFKGGNPGLYFSAGATPAGRAGINLDSDAGNNGEIGRPVDMRRWNEVMMERVGSEFVFHLNGERVYSMGAIDPSFFLFKAQRGSLEIRKFVALGYNP